MADTTLCSDAASEETSSLALLPPLRHRPLVPSMLQTARLLLEPWMAIQPPPVQCLLLPCRDYTACQAAEAWLSDPRYCPQVAHGQSVDTHTLLWLQRGWERLTEERPMTLKVHFAGLQGWSARWKHSCQMPQLQKRLASWPLHSAVQRTSHLPRFLPVPHSW